MDMSGKGRFDEKDRKKEAGGLGCKVVMQKRFKG